MKLSSSTFVVISKSILLLNLIACGGTNKKEEESESVTLPGAPNSVVISSDRPLEIFTLDLLSAITPNGSSAIVSGSGSTPTAGGLGYTAGGSSVPASGNVPSLDGTTASGSGAMTIDGSGPFTANISVAANFPAGATQSCNILYAFSSIVCSLTGFTFSDNDIITSTNLTVRAITNNGDANAYLDSNPLEVKKTVVEKVSAIESGGFYTSVVSKNMIEFGGSFYYAASNSNSVSKLFKLTGTTLNEFSNTSGNQSTSDNVYILAEYNSELYFSAFNSNGVMKLFKTNGTTITQVSNTSGSQTIADSPGRFTVYNDKAYFSANLSSTVRKLYSIDSNGLIVQISNTTGNNAVSDTPNYLMVWKNKLYFSSNIASGISKLFSYDGTTIAQISDTRGSSASDGIATPHATTDYIYFWANNQNSFLKLFKTDGTLVTQVSNTRNSEGSFDIISATPTNIPGQVEYNGKFYFWAANANNVFKLFATDGTTVTQVSNTVNDNSINDYVDNYLGFPKTLMVFNGMLYFASAKSLNVVKLFKTDGTTISQVSNTAGDGLTDYVQVRGIFNGDLYFTAIDSSGKEKLFKTDGSNVIKVIDITTGGDDFDSYQQVCTANNSLFYPTSTGLYFSAYSSHATCKETLFRVRSL